MKNIVKFLIVPVAIMLASAFVSTTYAADGLQVSPVTYELNLKPGTVETLQISVKNTSDKNVNYVLESEAFTNITDDGAPMLDSDLDLTDKGLLSNWITFGDGGTGTIPVGQSKKVSFTITVPANAAPGGHYAAVMARMIPDNDPNAQVTVATRVGATMLVSIDGAVTKSATLSDLSYPTMITRIGNSSFSARVNNTGNIYYKSKAKVEIKSLIGKTTTVDLGEHMIPHQNSRGFTGTWQNRFPLGRYVATFSATDGDSIVTTQTVTFWAFPLEIVIPIIVIIIAIILIMSSVRRKKGDIIPPVEPTTNVGPAPQPPVTFYDHNDQQNQQ